MPTTPVRVQASPGAGAEATLYTAGATVISANLASLLICNPTNSQAQVRVRISLAGAASAASQSIIDVLMASNSMIDLTTPLILAATDVVRVFCSIAGVNFHAYGQEATP